MQDSTLWWLVTAALVVVELQTTTFYLLMLGVGTAAGALAAHGGLPLTQQLTAAALVGTLGLAACRVWRRQRQDALPAQQNPQALLDIGQTVHVEEWTPDGLARVHYRGSTWSARLAEHPGQPTPPERTPPAPGVYRIAGIHGTHLILETSPHA